MTRSTKIAARKKIRAHLKRKGHQANFKVTHKLVMRWWNLLNHALFDGILLPPHSITIKEFRGDHGWCDPMKERGHIRMGINSKFRNKKQFITVLVHEMIHQWQWTAKEAGRLTHGKTFWQWKQRVRQVLDLPLSEYY